MRSRGAASRRQDALGETEIYGKHEHSTLPLTAINGGKPKRQQSCLQHIKKRWHKSEERRPLCGYSNLGLAPKHRFSVNVFHFASSFMALLVMFFIMDRFWIVLREQLWSRRGRVFPKQVRIEGAEFLRISSGSIEPLDFPVILPGLVSDESYFLFPGPLNAYEALAAKDVEYGLNLYFMEENVSRVIYHSYWEDEGEIRDYSFKDDDVETYYAYDDDYVRDVYKSYDDDDVRGDGTCRRVHWHRFHFPNCNSFHEMDMAVKFPVYLSSGAYRDVFVHKHEFLRDSENVILKALVWRGGTFTHDMYEFTHMDALVSERLTSNDRVVDIYGHCGVSVLSEFLSRGSIERVVVPGTGYIKQVDLHDEDDVKPQNTLSPSVKLDLAVQMAESIVFIHEFPEGKIVHNDIQLSQFLYASDGSIKFNDFNRAEPMLWDEDKQDFCRYRNGMGNGAYRSPEEYFDKPLAEKIDVYSFGNNVYGLLTGLEPFYEIDEEHAAEAQEKLKKGERPYLDPRYRGRSYEEDVLIDIMDACWAYNPDDRPHMTEVARILRSAQQSARERQ